MREEAKVNKIGDSNVVDSTSNSTNNIILQLKKEQLDIAKKWIQTGNVKVHKNTFTEKKFYYTCYA